MSDPQRLARLQALVAAQKKAGLRPEIPSSRDPEPWLDPNSTLPKPELPLKGRQHEVYRQALLMGLPRGAAEKIMQREPAGELLNDPPPSDAINWQEIQSRRLLNSMKKGGTSPTPPQQYPPELMRKLLGGSVPAKPESAQPFRARPGVAGPVLK